MASTNIAYNFAKSRDPVHTQVGTTISFESNGRSQVQYPEGGSEILTNRIGVIGGKVFVRNGVAIGEASSLPIQNVTLF